MVERLCERMPAHGELAASGISFLLRVLSASATQHGSALESALKHVGGMLDKWAGKKHSNMNPLFFSQLCERQPSIAWTLAPQVVKHAQTAPSDFHRTTCFEMLLTLARQTGVLKQHQNLEPYARTVLQEVPAALEAAAAQASGEDSSSKKVTKMLQAGLALALKCVELEDKFKMGVLDHGKLGAVAASVETSSTAQRAKSVQQAAMRLKQRAAGGKTASKPKANTPSNPKPTPKSASKAAPKSASKPPASSKKQKH